MTVGPYHLATDKLQWLVDDTESLVAEKMERALTTYDPKDPKNFKPGTYQHYKREGNYVALALVSHHDTDELFVVYVCGESGRTRIREWATAGKDSWSDIMENAGPDGEDTPRFTFIGPST